MIHAQACVQDVLSFSVCSYFTLFAQQSIIKGRLLEEMAVIDPVLATCREAGEYAKHDPFNLQAMNSMSHAPILV
jgi:hypothetical protein